MPEPPPQNPLDAARRHRADKLRVLSEVQDAQREAVPTEPVNPDARAPAGLKPQPHGGALAPAWTGGRGGTAAGAARRGTSMRAVKRECRDILAENSPHRMRRILELVDDPDGRVAIVAIKEANERLWGNGLPLGDGVVSDEGRMDLSLLTAEEQDELAAALTTVARLKAKALGEGMVIEG